MRIGLKNSKLLKFVKEKKKVAFIYLVILFCATLYVYGIYQKECLDSWALYGCEVFVAIFVLAMLLPLVGYFLFEVYGYTYQKVFLMSALAWGIVFQIIVPPLCGTDEWIHYKTAYWTSNFIMGTTTEEDTVLMREKDDIYEDLAYSRSALKKLAENARTSDGDKGEQMIATDSRNLKQWFRFVPSALGISFSRLLHLGSTPTLYMGRIFNMLLFVFVGWWCTKILPIGKAQMVNLTMIPLLMQQVSGYSYDCLSITFSILLFSLCIYHSRVERKIQIWDVLLILFAIGMVGLNKGVYVFFAIMLLTIPFSKVKESVKGVLDFKKIKYLLIPLIPVVIYMARLVIGRLTQYAYLLLFKGGNAGIEQAPEIPAWTISYAISHPLDTIVLFWHTLLGMWDSAIAALGGKLAGHVLYIPISRFWLLLLVFILLRLLMYKRGEGIGKKKYVIWIITFVAVLIAIWLGCMVRFTPAGASSIDVSVRYYIPLIACALIANGTKQMESKEILHFFVAQHIVMVGVAMEMFCAMFGR